MQKLHEKRGLLRSLMLIFLLSSLSYAAIIKSEEIFIELAENKAKWKVVINYASPVRRSDFFAFSFAHDIIVRSGEKALDCDVTTTEVGTLIECKGLENLTNITYEFTSPDLLTRIGRAWRFAYDFAILDVINAMNFTIALPPGYVICGKEEIGISPITPANYTVGSDGKRILIKWSFEQLRLGSVIRFSVAYKPALTAFFVQTPVVLLAASFAFLLAIFSVGNLRRRAKARALLTVLNEEERKVVEFLLRQRNKEATQKRIARELDMSKSKASRLLRALERRGVVKITRSGRTNRVKLAIK